MWNRTRPHDTRESLFSGHGIVRVWSMLPPTALPPFAAVLACELDPGASVGAHVQAEYPEIVIFVEGAGTVRVNGNAIAVSSGTTVPLPLGAALAIENDSERVALRYVIVKARG